MSEFFSNLLNSVDFAGIIFTILTGIITSIGVIIKKKYEEFTAKQTEKANTVIKKETIETCVQAVQQLYADLSGTEKFQKVVENATTILESKGITITEVEIQMLIESAVYLKNTLNSSTTETEKVETKEEIIEKVDELLGE